MRYYNEKDSKIPVGKSATEYYYNNDKIAGECIKFMGKYEGILNTIDF